MHRRGWNETSDVRDAKPATGYAGRPLIQGTIIMKSFVLSLLAASALTLPLASFAQAATASLGQ